MKHQTIRLCPDCPKYNSCTHPCAKLEELIEPEAELKEIPFQRLRAKKNQEGEDSGTSDFFIEDSRVFNRFSEREIVNNLDPFQLTFYDNRSIIGLDDINLIPVKLLKKDLEILFPFRSDRQNKDIFLKFLKCAPENDLAILFGKSKQSIQKLLKRAIDRYMKVKQPDKQELWINRTPTQFKRGLVLES